MENSTYKVRQIDKSCWEIDENGVRSFLVEGEEKALLVDTGFGTGDLKSVAESITKLPVMLVNTHADRDHTGCNHQFDEAFMHPSEYDRYHGTDIESCPARPLWEGDIIRLGGRCLKVILIPGHTPGSIALLDDGNRILFGGDSVQSGTIFMFGAGRDIRAYINSMTKLLTYSQRFDCVYPSHGPLPVTSDIIRDLITGAGKIAAGEINGELTEIRNIPVTLYDVGAAKFLYDGK